MCSLNTGLETGYTKRLIFSWCKKIKIKCNTGSAGLAVLVIPNGILIPFTAGSRINIVYNTVGDITNQFNELETTIEAAPGDNIAGALLPLIGTWTLDVIS